jgi:hypothetical protein
MEEPSNRSGRRNAHNQYLAGPRRQPTEVNPCPPRARKAAAVSPGMNITAPQAQSSVTLSRPNATAKDVDRVRTATK